jgi:hypothetical protein
VVLNSNVYDVSKGRHLCHAKDGVGRGGIDHKQNKMHGIKVKKKKNISRFVPAPRPGWRRQGPAGRGP